MTKNALPATISPVYPQGTDPETWKSTEVGGGSWQLAAGRFSPTRIPLTLLYPRPDAETASDEYHRLAQTGQSIDIKIIAAFGAYPYFASITQAPDGSSIGSWLTEQSNGDLTPSDSYCKLSIPALSAGNYPISVTITDQEGASVVASWTLNVGNNYYYVAPVALGLGDGSSRENAASFATAYGADANSVSPALGKVLEFAGGTYSVSQNITFNANKPRAWVDQPGARPEITATTASTFLARNASGLHMRGFRLSNFTLQGVAKTNDYYERQSLDDIIFSGCVGDPAIANNEAGVFFGSTSNATKRPYVWCEQLSFENCHEMCAFDWYSVGPAYFGRSTWATNRSTIEEPVYYPKSSCLIDMRHLTFDNPTPTINGSVNGIIDLGNNEFYSEASCHVRFCYVRSNAGGVAIASNTSSAASSTQNWIDHCTVVGGAFQARNYDQNDHVNVDRCVIQNSSAAVLNPEGNGVTATNLRAATSGLVDANGRLLNSADIGLYGHIIRGAA